MGLLENTKRKKVEFENTLADSVIKTDKKEKLNKGIKMPVRVKNKLDVIKMHKGKKFDYEVLDMLADFYIESLQGSEKEKIEFLLNYQNEKIDK
jgi:hypothetical protein